MMRMVSTDREGGGDGVGTSGGDGGGGHGPGRHPARRAERRGAAHLRTRRGGGARAAEGHARAAARIRRPTEGRRTETGGFSNAGARASLVRELEGSRSPAADGGEEGREPAVAERCLAALGVGPRDASWPRETAKRPFRLGALLVKNNGGSSPQSGLPHVTLNDAKKKTVHASCAWFENNQSRAQHRSRLDEG
jgi:hypothetical protein